VVGFLGGQPGEVTFAEGTGLEPVWASWGTSPRQSSRTLAASAGTGGYHSLTDLTHDLPSMPSAEHIVGVLHLASPHKLWLLKQGCGHHSLTDLKHDLHELSRHAWC
jgi:hypothetical protein